MATEEVQKTVIPAKLCRPRRSSAELASRTWASQKAEKKAQGKKINVILKKAVDKRSGEEKALLEASQDVVAELARRARQRQHVKKKMEEVEDAADVLACKAAQLSQAIQNANHLVVYTGAGVSTAASIPDYRGPNGVWTLLQKGLDVKTTSLVDADPTVTHMSLVKLQDKGLVQHIVSQNCDGLHLRSGFPQDALSEVHGNMYIEVCTKCNPERVYTRLFDVTERTGKFRHDTGRKCHRCRRPLRDSIVHFGEKGAVEKPLNWKTAIDAADQADMILCLGSSLKVLRRYPFLWATNRSKACRPKLYIVNLQWTPKDSQATLKINGKCDDVMMMVMDKLQLEIPLYERSKDPIFNLAVQLKPAELKTFTTKILQLSLSDMCNNNSGEKLTCDNSKSGCEKQSTTTSPGGATVKQDTDGRDDVKEELCTLKPGWFGKGCRKRVVKRRRSSQVSVESVKEEGDKTENVKGKRDKMKNGIKNERDKMESVKDEKDKMESVKDERDKMESVKDERDKMESVKDEKDKMESVKDERVKMESVKDERDKMESVKDERDKMESVKDEKDKMESVKDEKDKMESVKDEKDKMESVKDERVKMESVKDERDKMESVKDERDKMESVKDEKDKMESVKDEKDKMESVKDERDKMESVKDERDKTVRDKTVSVKDERVKDERDKTESVKDERDKTESVKDERVQMEGFKEERDKGVKCEKTDL